MIEELGDLNEKFYYLCSRLDKYCEKLSDEQYAYMQAVLLAQYKDEYTLLALKCGIETKREIDELQAKHDRLVPQRWRTRIFRRRKQNHAATLVDIGADEYAARQFAAIEARLAAELRERLQREAQGSAPGEVADEPADGAGDVSAAPMSDEDTAAEPSEGGATLEEIEAKLAREAWEKVTANAESADPKSEKSDESDGAEG